jgi:hypothetical protein
MKDRCADCGKEFELKDLWVGWPGDGTRYCRPCIDAHQAPLVWFVLGTVVLIIVVLAVLAWIY